MQFKTLDHTSIDHITKAFNAAFADYEIQLQLTAEELLQKVKIEDISFEFSVGAFDKGVLVGFIFFGIDDNVNGMKTAWDGGTGVIPSYRGQKLTQRMFGFILPMLKQCKVERVLLEVLENNNVAGSIYEKLDFVKTRKLNAYKGTLTELRPAEHKIEVLECFDAEHLLSLGDFQPPWQQMNRRVKNWGDVVTTIGIKCQKDVVAYAHYNTATKRVLQFAVKKEHRNKGMANALFSHIAGDNSAPITIINVDDGSPSTNSFLNSMGLHRFISQYEMEMDVKPVGF